MRIEYEFISLFGNTVIKDRGVAEEQVREGGIFRGGEG